MGRVRLVNRLAWGRLGGRSRVPVFVEDAAVGCSAMLNDMSFVAAIVFVAAARVASRAAAKVATEPGKNAATAAIVGAIAIAVEKPGDAREAIRLAASAATAGEAAATVAWVAAIGRIADPFAPVDIAATLAAGGLVVQPSLDAAVATADGLAAGAAFKRIAVRHPLFIRPAEERAPPAAARSTTTAAHILAAAAAGQKCDSTNPHSPPGNHREVL
jgi:hypothetical protein